MPVLHSEFGPHVMLDCRGCDPEKIDNLDYVARVLNELPDAIGMTKITQPYVFRYSGLVPEDKGITGIVIIAESHLSFHSFTEKDFFFFDIFSCKPFDVEKAVRFVVEAFDVKHYDYHHVARGRDFPRAVGPDADSFLSSSETVRSTRSRQGRLPALLNSQS